MSEISLREWALIQGVPYRTALNWVKKGKLKPERKKKKIEVVRVVSVRGYFLPSDTTVPA